MNAKKSPPAQLADEQLDRLEQLLDDPALSEAMCLDEIQGFLCAVLSGPQALPEEQWLPDILGSDAALATAAGQEATGLLRHLATSLEAELAAGIPPLLLLYPKENDEHGLSDYLPWCQAYLVGVDAAEEDWFEFLGETKENDKISDKINEEISYLDERLFPVIVLTGEAEVAARECGQEWPENEAREELINGCEDDLAQAVTDIFRFWAAKR